MATIDGTEAADVLNGTDGADMINAGGGDDLVLGNGGDDVITGGPGADRLFGGAGNDRFVIDAQTDIAVGDSVDGGDGFYDKLVIKAPVIDLTALIFSGSGVEQIIAGNGVVTLSLSQLATFTSGIGTIQAQTLDLTGDGQATTNAYLNVRTINLEGHGVVLNATRTGSTTFNGTDGDDTIRGGAGSFVQGFAGDDTLAGHVLDGGTGNDHLSGYFLADGLYGGAGDDYLNGGHRKDYMAGGTGDDIYVVDNAGDTVVEYSGEGVDTVRTTLTSYTLPDYTENLVGIGAHRFNGTGNGLDNVITGVFAKPNVLSGLDGDDRLLGGDKADTLIGGNGDDVLRGGGGGDMLDGGAGFDTADYSDADAGVTIKLGVAGAQLTGNGADTLIGIEGVRGSQHDDRLTADDGGDVLDGQAGDDMLTGGAGNDTLVGGEGTDTANYFGMSAGVTVNLALAGPQDTGGGGIDTLSTLENLVGTAYGDALTGDDGANLLMGNAGDDILMGGGGADVLNGGLGVDRLIGGEGNDRFVYVSIYQSGVLHPDLISDMTMGDILDLGGIDADTTTAGDQAFVIVGSLDGHAGEMILRYDAAVDQTRLFGDVNGDGRPDFSISFTGDVTHDSGAWIL